MEALKANDNDLFCLLKSQWAHRFGVESLEELQNLDLTLLDQNTINKDNQKNHLFQVSSFEVDREIFNKDYENDENKAINTFKEYKSQPEIEALIPLPPKPKYSYLKKWLLRK